MDKVVFIGEYKFPSNFASCNRVLNMAKCVKLSGYDPLIIGKGKMDDDVYSVYNEITYTSMQPKQLSKFKKIILFPYRHLSYKRALKKEVLKNKKIKAVIIYASSSARYVPQVIKLCKKNGIKCVCDISEWYDKKQFKYGIFNLNYLIFTYMFKRWFKRADSIICCSDLVKNHFEKEGCSCLLINGIIDIKEYDPSFEIPNQTTLIYSGVAGKKDNLVDLLRAYDSLDDIDKDKINIKIIGMSRSYLKNLLKEMDYELKEDEHIKIYDRMSHDDLFVQIRESSYSVLLRPNKRYANAGFASKVPESLALGTPMFCNITSDLGRYLNDKNSIIVKDCSTESIAVALNKLIHDINADAISEHRKKAYNIAKNNFDIHCFVDEFKCFIEE